MGGTAGSSPEIAGAADLAEVIATVEAEYGVRVRNIRLYKGEYDSNIRFDDPERGTWLAKVSAADLGEEIIGWQETVLDAVAASRDLGFQTPRILLTREGHRHVRTPRFLVRVVSWISGRLMTDRDEAEDFDAELLGSLGASSAQLTRALSEVSMPATIAEHEWTIRRGPEVVGAALGVLGERGVARGIADQRQVGIVREITDRFDQTVLPRLTSLPWAVIHHDLHDANVILNAAGTSVAGVIDFNDAVCAPRVSDLAICAGYAMLRQDDPERAFGLVSEGYRRLIDLTEDEAAVVGEMALMRLCINWAQWQSRALESADGEYAMARSQFTWPLIEHLAESGVPTV